MKKHYLLIIMLCGFFAACGQPTTKTKHDVAVEDVNIEYLSNLPWKGLTEFVEFYVLERQIIGNATRVDSFKISLNAIYHYGDNEYEFIKDSSVFCSYDDLTKLTLNDSLFICRKIDCFIKINSEIAYLHKPELLKTIFLKPKDASGLPVSKLIDNIKSLAQVEKVETSDIAAGGEFKDLVLSIEIKEHLWNLNEVTNFSQQLRGLSNVSEVFTTDFFTGNNKQDLIYRVTSVE